MAPKDSKQRSKGVGVGFFIALIPVLIALFPAIKTLIAGDPLIFMIPNMLNYTPYRNETKAWWDSLIPDFVDPHVTYGKTPIPIIAAENYTFENLRQATENFRYPALVKGLFKGTPALKKWITPDYLPSKIGEFVIPAVRDAVLGSLQNNRTLQPFSEAFHDIISNPESKTYLFFPVNSRFNTNGSAQASAKQLRDVLNKVTLEDLQLERIWPGFGTSEHKTYLGAQLIMGQGTASSATTTGTGWHCAPGNNWFIQIAGKKRWYFMDQHYSSRMQPIRGGKNNMMTGTRATVDRMDNIPLRYTDIEEGDLLYNPDWEWHTIENYEGLSMGVPIREFNISLSLRNNLHYTSIVGVNNLFEKFGIDVGGYPPS